MKIKLYSLFFFILLFYTTAYSQQVVQQPKSLKEFINEYNNVLIILNLHNNRQIDEVKKLGGYIENSLGNDKYLVNINKSTHFNHSLFNNYEFLPVETKINPLLKGSPYSGVEINEVLVSVSKQMDISTLRKLLKNYNIQVSDNQALQHAHIIKVKVLTQDIATLSHLPFIISIHPALQDISLNDQARAFTGTAQAAAPSIIGGYNLTGKGVVIGVGDDTDPTHIDYDDRLTSFNPRLASSHGVHVTGTVGGAGLRDERYKGFSPEATLIAHFFSGIVSDAPIFTQDFNMVLTNNSYTGIIGNCSYAGTYDIYGQYLDQLAHDRPQLLNIFAAGNDANRTCAPYPFGFATIQGTYQSSKNPLIVGNIGKSTEIINVSTSRGPTKDGRMKPEITAVGTNLVSGNFNNEYFANTGTSMAAPNVTGAAGLLVERYRQLFGATENPENALTKIVLMNGATDIGNEGPDYRYGFGLMNINNSLRILNNHQYSKDSIIAGEIKNFNITVPANTDKIKIMLYWNDADALPLAEKTLINDLDLKAIMGSNTYYPYVLDPRPAFVNNVATTGTDTINNVEYIEIEAPADGSTVQIQVSASTTPIGNVPYYVAFDFIPKGIQLLSPFGSEKYASGDSAYIYFNATNKTTNIKLELSTDAGISWSTLNESINPNLKHFVWYIPEDLSSTKCRIRISQPSLPYTVISNNFTVLGRPIVSFAVDEQQCPGSIKINWEAIPNAESYNIYIDDTGKMVERLNVSATTLQATVSGLKPNKSYWIAVAPVYQGNIGMRSVAMQRTPNSGDCQGHIINGDLALLDIIGPQSGRQLTSTTLLDAAPLIIKLANWDDVTANNYSILYQLNEQPWQSKSITTNIPAAGQKIITISDAMLDLSEHGDYLLKVVVKNNALPDPVQGNDTLIKLIRHASNDQLNVTEGYLQNFEQVPNITLQQNMIALDSLNHWDYFQSTPFGRLRTFVNSAVSITGAKSLSLDNSINTGYDLDKSSNNRFIGTFNLQGNDLTGLELRLETDYRLSGVPKFDTANQIWIRGNDTDNWIPVYNFDTTYIGIIGNSGSISLNDFLIAHAQNFSTSTQVMIGQFDTSKIANNYFGNGLTIDNIKLYQVNNDVQLLSIDSLYYQNCNLSNETPIRATVRNGVFYDLYDISISYQIDDGAIITEIIDTLLAKDTAFYVFNETADMSEIKAYNVSIWVHLDIDSFKDNDSIINHKVRNSPVISDFPYLNNFEENDGFFHAGGVENGWELNTPNGNLINRAASGKKAWITHNEGNYLPNSTYYLYSPCYDISSLENPTLSFFMSSNIENSTEQDLYDQFYIEYAGSDNDWQRLGTFDPLNNWYDDERNVWANQHKNYWQSATTPLPQTNGNIMFRLVFKTDGGAEFEGIAFDDWHIYDLQQPIFDEQSGSGKIVQNIPGDGSLINYDKNNKVVGQISSVKEISDLNLQSYMHTTYINQYHSQYYFPQNFNITTPTSTKNEYTVYVYLLDTLMKVIREDNNCSGCDKVQSVVDLGITQYQSNSNNEINNNLEDNIDGKYSFLQAENITWIPYDKGYIARFKSAQFGEIWFNKGGPTNNLPIDSNYIQFSVGHWENNLAKINWQFSIDEQIALFEVQSANEDMVFNTIAQVESQHDPSLMYQLIDHPELIQNFKHYRLHYKTNDDTWHYSEIKSLIWDDSKSYWNIYPNPVVEKEVNLEWIKGNKENIDLAIYDIQGKLYLRKSIEEANYSGKVTIQIPSYSSGVYVLKIKNGKFNKSLKFVIKN